MNRLVHPNNEKIHPKIQKTRLGLQCRTPLRSYPLTLIPYPLTLPLVPYPLVLLLPRKFR